MHRRRFIVAVGATALTAFAGCLSDKSPPPRKSNVVERIEPTDQALRIDLADRAWVASRYDPDGKLREPSDLAPVGVAEAKGGVLGGGGRGSTGRGSGGYRDAHKTNKHGWAWWHGGAYAAGWYDDHEEDVTRYDVRISEVGIKHFGPDSEFRDNRPGAGAVAWDQTYDSPKDLVEHPVQSPGWYRVGVHIVGREIDRDFMWECVDFELARSGTGYDVTNEWKVSPRI